MQVRRSNHSTTLPPDVSHWLHHWVTGYNRGKEDMIIVTKRLQTIQPVRGIPVTVSSNFNWPHVRESGFCYLGSFCLWNPEFGKFLLQSGIWNLRALESGIKLKESGILLGIRNPISTNKESEIYYLESGIQNSKFRTQNCLVLLYMRQNNCIIIRFWETAHLPLP